MENKNNLHDIQSEGKHTFIHFATIMEKHIHLDEYSSHLQRSKGQREYYRGMCLQSKETYSHMTDQQKLRGNFESSRA